MTDHKYAISIVITAHDEGQMVLQCVEMVWQSIAYASSNRSIAHEILVALDCPDFETRKILKYDFESERNVSTFELDFMDIGLVRNKMISLCKNDLIFFVDADDLWSKNWISKVLDESRYALNSIFHPEHTYFVDRENTRVFQNFKLKKFFNSKYTLLFENHWTSSFATKKTVFNLIRFKSGKVGQDSGIFAFEDWTFFRDTLFLGFKHEIVSDTFHINRIKESSNTSLSGDKFPHPFD